MSGAIMHTVVNVDAFARTGECRICGPVKVRRRGDRAAPWRCASQVNEYKRERRLRLEDERRTLTSLRATTPCGDKVVLPPFEEDLPADGGAIEYNVVIRCSCGRVHLVVRRRAYDMCWSDESGFYPSRDVCDEVFWLDAHEIYTNGEFRTRETTRSEGPKMADWATVGEGALVFDDDIT